MTRVRADQPRRILLVVDQFEQVFTQCSDEEQRQAFITALHAAASVGHGGEQVPAALVVLVVRADFEARCADYPQLTEAVRDRYLVTSMTRRQLRQAITEPARTAGSSVEAELVETLLAEVQTSGAPSGDARWAVSAVACCRCCRTPWTRPGAAAGRTVLTAAPTTSGPAASKALSPRARNAPTTA